ncbi:uncharacterized protein LOC105631094 [Jatropha curcas]|uniref:uncharacterized protein LOC105631094 n=1 Tax=Jatropha curcas TaxID=180498 RepID=UPI0005FB88C1|nr:uncharacterized protein LOC105631094 [Jatropha curcas]
MDQYVDLDDDDDDEELEFKQVIPITYKMPKVPKYDGNGDPKMHLMQYKFIMELRVRGDWNELTTIFLKEYTHNLQMSINLRDLETIVQKQDETFTDYMARWRAKVMQMRKRPKTKVYEVGTAIEDKIREDRKYGNRAGDFSKSGFQGSSQSAKTLSTNKNTTTVALNFRATNVPQRRFSNFGTSLSSMFEKVKAAGLLRLLAPRPPPIILPKNFNQNAYCHFHKSKGHTTNNCLQLKHKIQGLIDNGKVTEPEKLRPSTRTNPLSNFRNVLPPKNLYMVESSTTPEEVMVEFEEEEVEGEKEILLE